jgi:hypothetical protein
LALSDEQNKVAHVGHRPRSGLTIDRIDNDRGYEPGNVRWATRFQQAASQRRPNKKRTPEGVAAAKRLRAEGLVLREIGERLGISLPTAREWLLC